ncbi:patatin-like phospholipase family protein [Faecalibaculum rodentium]|jgi:predicted patatin/cPLA2 family phospholipase|uniref:Patatin family protein n=1 Tax=Faecalibaculum rodentium TaxID=1702221 RepID=A0A1Q9YHA5_9FIRM|nr:patatin family protein [Faecalibaculum rodentium]OLU43542.1 patatin family protein [Faecalibaculum rodentium]
MREDRRVKTGLVVEGGGTKIAYTGGVLQCFLEQGIDIPYCVGISAGAMMLLPYVSRQPGRLRLTGVDAASQKDLIGLKPIMEEGSLFALEKTAQFIQEKMPLDYETFFSSPTQLDIGVYDMKTRKTRYYGKEYVDASDDLLIASCSLLLLSKPKQFDGNTVIDAGLTDMIPVSQALKAGCEKVIVVSTKEEGYRRKKAPWWQLMGARLVYHDRQITEDFRNRHIHYEEQWQIIHDLEKEGKALVLRPHQDYGITRYTTDREKLDAWFKLGYAETLERLGEIRAFLDPDRTSDRKEAM